MKITNLQKSENDPGGAPQLIIGCSWASRLRVKTQFVVKGHICAVLYIHIASFSHPGTGVLQAVTYRRKFSRSYLPRMDSSTTCTSRTGAPRVSSGRCTLFWSVLLQQQQRGDEVAHSFLSAYLHRRRGIAYVTVFNSSATWAASHIPSSGGTSACWLFSCFHNPPNSD